jgi:hypothetical protein
MMDRWRLVKDHYRLETRKYNEARVYHIEGVGTADSQTSPWMTRAEAVALQERLQRAASRVADQERKAKKFKIVAATQ